MHRIALWIGQLILATGLAGAQTPTAADPAPPVEAAPECPYTAAGSAPDTAGSLACICTREAVSAMGALYGTDRYTIDSPICPAANHAGATGPDGGPVTVYRAESCNRFLGSERNGKKSGDWDGRWDSYAFVTPLPPCAGETPEEREKREAAAARAAGLVARLAKDCTALGHSAAYCACAADRMEDTLTRDAALALYGVEDALMSGNPPAETGQNLVEQLNASPIGAPAGTDESKIDLDKTFAKLKRLADAFAAKLQETCRD